MLHRGSTFLMGSEDLMHLHVIVTAPNAAQEVLVAPITTIKRFTADQFIRFEAGDHPFIRHPSAVASNYAKIYLLHRLQLLADQRTIKVREDMPESLIRRIAAGLLDSEFAENGVKHFLRELGFP